MIERINEKLKTSKACMFKAGKQLKRMNGDWDVRYGWELFDANNRSMCCSEWKGFETLDEALEDMLKNIV